MPDRIETGTFLCAAAITGGKIQLQEVIPEHVTPIVHKLEEAGCAIQVQNRKILIEAPKKLKAVDIKTMPYPGFPTDMQSILGAVLTTAKGTSIIIENIFGLPGIGNYLIKSIQLKDFPVILGFVFIMSFTVVILNLISELIGYALDPRIRMEIYGK